MINAEVFHRLLQQPSLLNECSEADLEMLAYQYPWFGTAQLLLAAKQKQSGRINAEKQLQKAALYFRYIALIDLHHIKVTNYFLR